MEAVPGAQLVGEVHERGRGRLGNAVVDYLNFEINSKIKGKSG